MSKTTSYRLVVDMIKFSFSTRNLIIYFVNYNGVQYLKFIQYPMKIVRKNGKLI